jgi:hypothetical protein
MLLSCLPRMYEILTTIMRTYVKFLKLYYRQPHLKYLCNFARY